MTQDIRNIGIFAHVDAGKTTLSEQLLHHSGAIRETGAVDAGTAHTDRMDIERRRGISIRATCAPLTWRGVRINLIDTPGHADFAAEVERAMWALDGAVLLLSAIDGVQPQTGILFDALRRAGLPVVLFVNKMDWPEANLAATVAQARAALDGRIVDICDDDQLHALLAEEDEAALEAYLEGRLYPRDRLLAGVRALARAGRAFPLWHGSALRGEGVEALLDGILACLPPPSGREEAPPSGIVFATQQDRTLGRAAMVRMFTGALANRAPTSVQPLSVADALTGQKPQEAKVTQIRDLALEGRGADLGVLRAGEIGLVYGLGETRVGDIVGDREALGRELPLGRMATPLLMTRATTKDPAQAHALRGALETLAGEDPLLDVQALGGALHVRVMGAIQLEVLTELIATRFGIDVAFGPPNVIYRETIARPATGFFAYTMPKPCWAVIKFQLEPLPTGSGIEYASVVPAREIMPRYQHQIEQALPLALRQGMLGWQVDDVRITLIGGEHHLIHTHPLDFILATPVALMDGLARAGSVLLEPILAMHMTVPEQAFGRVASEIAQMRGEVTASALQGDTMRVQVLVPMATSVDFSIRLASLTSGRGALSVRLHGYRPCEADPPPECPRRGVHPLDTAKYILAARGAVGGGIFES